MSEPFLLSKSDNLIKAHFTESFHHARHYRYLINSVLHVTSSHFQHQQWAILIEWGSSFVQIPEEEKLCMRFLHEYYQKGLKYLVNVTPSHPVVDWQMQKIAKANPEVEILTTDLIESGELWLGERGIDVDTVTEKVSSDWAKKSKAFTFMIEKYGVERDKFDPA